jgi:hypothetical protein
MLGGFSGTGIAKQHASFIQGLSASASVGLVLFCDSRMIAQYLSSFTAQVCQGGPQVGTAGGLLLPNHQVRYAPMAQRL